MRVVRGGGGGIATLPGGGLVRVVTVRLRLGSWFSRGGGKELHL
jgi:hypothetical protein